MRFIGIVSPKGTFVKRLLPSSPQRPQSPPPVEVASADVHPAQARPAWVASFVRKIVQARTDNELQGYRHNHPAVWQLMYEYKLPATERDCIDVIKSCLCAGDGEALAIFLDHLPVKPQALSLWGRPESPLPIVHDRAFDVLGRQLLNAPSSSVTTLELIHCHLTRDCAITLANTLRVNASLSDVRLIGCWLDPDVIGTLVDSLGRCDKLTSLRLQGFGITDAHTGALAGILKHRALTYLDLSGNEVGPGCAEAIGAALKTNASLKNLDLKSNVRLTDAGACALLNSLKSNTCLTHLDLSACVLTQGIRQATFNLLVSSCGLTDLSLCDNEIGTETVKVIGAALTTNQTLRCLDLSDNDLEPGAIGPLTEGLKRNPTLVNLVYASNQCGAEGARHFAALLAHNTSLESLDISDCGIAAPGCKSIFDALASNTRLRKLELGANDISAIDVTALVRNVGLETLSLDGNPLGAPGNAVALACQSLSRLVREHTTLTNLDLSGCKIPDDAAVPLANAIAHGARLRSLNTIAPGARLRSLNLSDNQIGDQSVQELAKGAPHLRFLDLSGNNISHEGILSLAESLPQHNHSLVALQVGGNPFSQDPVHALAGLAALEKGLARQFALLDLDLGRWRIKAGGEQAKALRGAIDGWLHRNASPENRNRWREVMIRFFGQLRQTMLISDIGIHVWEHLEEDGEAIPTAIALLTVNRATAGRLAIAAADHPASESEPDVEPDRPTKLRRFV